MSDRTRAILAFVFALVCVFGSFYSWMNLREALGDLRAVMEGRTNGVLRFTARGNVRRERARLVYWLLGLTIGVTVASFSRSDVVRMVTSLVLLMSFGLNAYSTYRDRKDRDEVRDHAEGVVDERLQALEERVTAEEARNTDIEGFARETKERADRAEERADRAETRADEHGRRRPDEHD